MPEAVTGQANSDLNIPNNFSLGSSKMNLVYQA